MKLRTAVLCSMLGVLASVGGAMAIPLPNPTSAYTPARKEPASPGGADVSHFNAGQTLTIDARLGHASVAKAASGETFLFASIAGTQAARAQKVAAPLDLGVVIDRSGSMKGERIANAINAAVGIVERMRDGDTITVVSFDTDALTVVPPTRVSVSTRPAIEASIRGIRLGGDTCISCGLESAMQKLEAQSSTGDVRRMILLSDGATNHGITDVAGLRSMAGRMRDKGFAITTMGVDVDFDEKVMATIAAESNGRHYFVENASSLPKIFSQEFDSLLASVASDAELEVELAPGVDAEEVFDRSFRREGNKVFVPFGTFSADQEKTVLMKLRVPAAEDGARAVASMRLVYKDLVKGTDGTCGGDLALRVVSDGSAQAELDPFVAARVERSKTAKALLEANELFEQGKIDEARTRLATQRAELSRTAAFARAAEKKAPRAIGLRPVGEDLEGQLATLDKSEDGFDVPRAAPQLGAGSGGGFPAPANAPPAPMIRQGKAQVRTNAESAVQLGF